jgi:hypothetical protein
MSIPSKYNSCQSSIQELAEAPRLTRLQIYANLLQPRDIPRRPTYG